MTGIGPESGGGRRIESKSGGEGVLWGVCVVWFGAMGAFLWLGGRNTVCFCSLMGLLGLVPLRLAFAVRRMRLNFGEAHLEILAPGSPGGRLEGVVHVRGALPAEAYLRLTLVCLRRGDADSNDQVVWRGVEFTPPLPPEADGAGRIPVRLEIPATSPPSGGPQAGDCYWILTVFAERGAKGLDASFEVPVRSSS